MDDSPQKPQNDPETNDAHDTDPVPKGLTERMQQIARLATLFSDAKPLPPQTGNRHE